MTRSIIPLYSYTKPVGYVYVIPGGLMECFLFMHALL